ncbi:MAG TPA: hypothetical protein VIL63_08425 [Terriglobales bacterium]
MPVLNAAVGASTEFGKGGAEAIKLFVEEKEISNYVVYAFDGKFYRLTECYQKEGEYPVKKVPCG